MPRADYLRWELGFDRFFFARTLNPTNSFTWVTAMVGSYNLNETSQSDFRYSGVFKPEYWRSLPARFPSRTTSSNRRKWKPSPRRTCKAIICTAA